MVLSYSVYAFTYNHKLFLCHTIETHDILAEGPTLAAMMKFTYIPYACCRAICCHIVHNRGEIKNDVALEIMVVLGLIYHNRP